jgi:pimeloyl-ACP methyl ester carboxylesterase
MASSEQIPGVWQDRTATVNGVRLHYVEVGDRRLNLFRWITENMRRAGTPVLVRAQVVETVILSHSEGSSPNVRKDSSLRLRVTKLILNSTLTPH